MPCAAPRSRPCRPRAGRRRTWTRSVRGSARPSVTSTRSVLAVDHAQHPGLWPLVLTALAGTTGPVADCVTTRPSANRAADQPPGGVRDGDVDRQLTRAGIRLGAIRSMRPSNGCCVPAHAEGSPERRPQLGQAFRRHRGLEAHGRRVDDREQRRRRAQPRHRRSRRDRRRCPRSARGSPHRRAAAPL